MRRKLKWTLVGGAVVAASILCAVLCSQVVQSVRFQATVGQAREAYESSRAGAPWKPGSYAFITRGVQAGDTEQQVSEKMEGASKVGRYGYTDDGGKEAILVCYVFTYSPKYVNPLTKAEQPL